MIVVFTGRVSRSVRCDTRKPFEASVAHDDGSTSAVTTGELTIEIEYRRCDTMNGVVFEHEMEDTVEVANLLHAGFTPEPHGWQNKVRMRDAAVKATMAEHVTVLTAHNLDTANNP